MNTVWANKVLMVRPVRFGWNRETSLDNPHMTEPTEEAQAEALREFDGLAKALTRAGIGVQVFDDTPEPATPDSIFPNNWFSTHEGGKLVLYPMSQPSRAAERKPEIVDWLRAHYPNVVDLTAHETEGRALEGTGSLVFGLGTGVAFAGLSARTDGDLAIGLCGRLGFRPVLFRTMDFDGRPAYHTNILMALGEGFCLLCEEAVHPEDRSQVLDSIASCGVLVALSLDQMRAFTGNGLQLQGPRGLVFVLSDRGAAAVRPDQRRAIESKTEIVTAPLDTIERVAGGSARCMLAELF
ncbi:MAG: amidinotransferase [Fimbriimonas ginsengisoli]|uniref:Amidinotransferase n=1 Tax=Fimbriimonas ginsengisoli TaxID=1005039 RepID=A0A931LUC7_FIMGI|nr:amidinotransferase [Fimbriimonas ginsengisoli]